MGLLAGVALVLIGLTGSVLVFRREIENLLMPRQVLAANPSAARLGLDALVACLRKQLDGCEPVGWLPSRSPTRNDEVYVVGRDGGEPQVVWIDAGSGTVHGVPMDPNKTFTGWLLELHYSFLSGHTGVFLAGIFAVLLCLLGISGLWIYRGFWRNFLRLRWKVSARILLSNLHKTAGVSSVAFNLILGFTGAYWNLTHVADHLLNGPEPEPPKMSGRIFVETVSLDALIEQATEKIPHFQWTYLSLPSKADEPLVFYGRLANQHPLRGEYGSSVTFNSQTGAFEGLLDIRTSGFWNQVTDAFMPLHYGTFGALPVKILWSIGGLAPGVLAITGFALWWKRKKFDRRRTLSFSAKAADRKRSKPR